MDHLRGVSNVIPRHNIKELFDEATVKRLILTEPHQLVRFNIAPKRNIQITEEDHRLNRIKVRCSSWPPLAMWAHWVLRTSIFHTFLVTLIFVNAIGLLIEAELRDNMSSDFASLKTALAVERWFAVIVFILEIVLKMIDNISGFWKNSWNVFDFFITALSIVPELARSVYALENTSTMQFLRIFRILRPLKLFSRFRQLRIIILAIGKSFKAMTFIILMLLILTYVFTVSGISIFQTYTRSDRTDLQFNTYFSDMPNALVTSFIMFTADHWYALLQDTWKITDLNRTITGLYVIVWLLIATFIFKNIIVGIMVNNFQALRANLAREVKQIETQRKANLFKMQLFNRRQSEVSLIKEATSAREGSTHGYPTGQQDPNTADYGPQIRNPDSQSSQNIEPEVDWDTFVHKNLPILKEQYEDDRTTWPRDSLFKYFELMEQLQSNLDERKKLQQYAAQMLLNLHDQQESST
ncbi:cation channel sperm-associated protein 2 [Ascaphus truei]|uniref:cation channel sperm-associated protein 2 n=1 Tax=Ascaphus truei TaxID=8439 RepID=UPI003F595BB7